MWRGRVLKQIAWEHMVFVTLGKAMSSVALLGPESLFARLAWEREGGQVFFGVLDLCCGCKAILD